MKKILSYITVCLVAAAPLAGCIEADYPKGEGRLVIGVDFGESLAAQGETRSLTGKTRAAAPAAYTVKIGHSGGYTHIFDQNEVPDELWLAAGSYFIEVFAGEPAAPGWSNNLCYYGRQVFTITGGDDAVVTVNVGVRNTLFTIDFDETVEQWLTDYSLTLFPDPADEAETLVFDAENAGATANIVLGANQTEVAWLFKATHETEGEIEQEGVFENLAPGKEYEASFKYSYQEKEGSFTLTVTVDDTTDDKGHLIIISKDPRPAETFEIVESDVWATHTTVTGKILNAGEVRFGYRPTGSAEWLYASGVEGDSNNYSAVLSGLAPQTEYETCIELDGEFIGEAQVFTTTAAPQLPNWNLEDWHKNNVYYPYLSGATPFWGSGNVRAMGIINVEMTTPVEGRTPGTKAAQLQSKVTVGTFGAGNLFTGSFRLSGTTGYVNFGREFTARPSGLKVSYKATTGMVTNSGGGGLSVGQPDQFQIQIALADSGFPHEINTSNTSTFINYETHAGVIAYGEIHGSVDMADWAEAVIPLNYRSTTRKPTHIVVIASASRYGDYFTGSTSSVMWVDDFELVYDENVVIAE